MNKPLQVMVLVLASAMALLAASTKSGKSRHVPTSATNPALQVEPLDLATPRVPKFFAGSPVDFIHAMFIGGPKKGEFETTAEYELRKKKYFKVGVYPFQPNDISIAYDADAAEFHIRVEGEILARTGSPPAEVSAFKAATVVPRLAKEFSAGAEHATDTYQLIALNAIKLPVELTLPMAREKARISKDYLRVLLLLSLDATSAAYVVQRNRLYRAELRELATAEPYPRYDFALTGNIAAFWIYDFRTGEVLVRQIVGK